MAQQNEPQLLQIIPNRPNWVGPSKRKPLENFTGETLFSLKQHNKVVKLMNVLYDLHLVARIGGGPNNTKSIEAKITFSDDNTWIELDLNDLVGVGGGVTECNLVNVKNDYLVCAPINGSGTLSVAKPFKLRFSLTQVVEYSTTYKFLYSNGTESAVYGAIFQHGFDGYNLLRLKTSDSGASSFPTSMTGYDKNQGEIEAVIPLWTPTANTPNDIIYAQSISGGITTVGSTKMTDLAGNAVTMLSVGDNRQWAKVDPPLTSLANVLQFKPSLSRISKSVVVQSNPVSGSKALGNGVGDGTVSGLDLSFTPVGYRLNVSRPSGGLMLFANLNSGTLTSDGFSFELSGLTDSTNYVLDWTLFPT